MNLVIPITFSSFLFTPPPPQKKKQSCLYQEIDRHLQCAMNFTKFLRNYQSIVAQFGYGLSADTPTFSKSESICSEEYGQHLKCGF